MQYISYLRVSTNKQGIDGLGIESQRRSVKLAFGEPVKEYLEVESGKKNNRPELKKAIDECKATGSTLVIAKIDRLARNVAFIANLMESGIKFKAADMPQVDNLTIHILSAVAEKERLMISDRTKKALAVLKSNGVKLGCPEITKEGRLRTDIIKENRSKRVYAKPDPFKVETLKVLKSAGQSIDKIQETATILFGRHLSKVTLYSYLKA